MGHIICTQNKFNALNLKCMAHVRSQFNAKVDRWCSETIHPTDGRIAFIVQDRILDILSPVEKGEIVELTEDWFDTEGL